MADTIRTLTANKSLLADNTTNDISPQDIRDMVESIVKCYGGLYVDDGSTAQGSIGTSYTQLINWAADMDADGLTPDFANNQIDVDTNSDGLYLIMFTASLGALSSSAVFTLALAKNDTEITGAKAEISTVDATGRHAVTIVALVSLVATDDISVRIKASAGPSTVTIEQAQLVMKRLA